MISDQTFILKSKYLKWLDFKLLDEQTSSLKKDIDTNENECISYEYSSKPKLNK